MGQYGGGDVRSHADRSQLTPLTQAAFGSQRRLLGVARLRGGSKKGVYRVTFDDESTAIVYIWDAAEDYWTSVGAEPAPDHADVFSHNSGLNLFEAAQARLDELEYGPRGFTWLTGAASSIPLTSLCWKTFQARTWKTCSIRAAPGRPARGYNCQEAQCPGAERCVDGPAEPWLSAAI
jgi:hypothetical protein